MFEKASRLKLRFDTKAGNVTAEDLWDMPLSNATGFSLDDLAKSLNRSLKESEEESFVVKKSATSGILDLKFSIVKYVIKVKLDEKEQAENAVARKAQKEKILAILEKKEDDALEGKSASALKKMLEDL